MSEKIVTFKQIEIGGKFRSVVGVMCWQKTGPTTATCAGRDGDERFRLDETVYRESEAA